MPASVQSKLWAKWPEGLCSKCTSAAGLNCRLGWGHSSIAGYTVVPDITYHCALGVLLPAAIF